MQSLRVTWRVIRLALHILVGLVLTPLVATRHAGGIRRSNPYVTSWWHNRLIDILGVHVTVAGYRPQPPALLVSNHVSWLDIIVLGALTHTVFLSKDEVRQWPLIGWLAARAGTLFIRRGNGETASITEQIAGRLRDQGLLTLFPEGTTTDGREVRPFFSRLFAAAVDTGTDVVPVAIRYHVDGAFDPVAPYTGDQSLVDNLRGMIGRPRTEVHVVFCPPLSLKGQTRKQAAEAARNAIVGALAGSSPRSGEDVAAPAAG